MPKNIHSQQTANAASKDCAEKQDFFWNTPKIFSCLDLIHKHKDKANCIDYKKIDTKYFKQHKISFQEGTE